MRSMVEGPCAEVWPLHHRIFVRWSPSPSPLSQGQGGTVVAAPAVSYLPSMSETELLTDVALGVTIPARDARGSFRRSANEGVNLIDERRRTGGTATNART